MPAHSLDHVNSGHVSRSKELDPDEEYEAPRAKEQKLQRIPQREEEHQVEPLAPALLNESGAGDCNQHVDDAEEHRGYSPFEAASGAQLVEEMLVGIQRRMKMRVWMLAFQSRFRSMMWASLLHAGLSRCGWS